MRRWIRSLLALGGVAMVSAMLPRLILAQGVTTAAVQGTVRAQSGTPLEGAIVTLINNSTGSRFQAESRPSGRYVMENVPVGGPYTIEARAIGYEAGRKTEVMLSLGQRFTADFSLTPSVVQLEELTVSGTIDPLINRGRTGPASTVSDSTIANLPLLGRNFTDLVLTLPQVVPTSSAGGRSIGGQNNRFNTIQIDGGVNNDIFGLAASGTPGGQANAKPISLEAVQEFQVLTAPFDVRQGSFSGGLLNAVTKSGTNRFTGSVFGYLQSQDLVGADTAGADISAFNVKQFGGTLGGPIIRDRLHFFVSADIQKRESPFTGQSVAEGTTGISQARVDSVQSILVNQYGFDPGNAADPTLENPDKNLFGKITYQLGVNSQLEISHNFVDATSDEFIRDAKRNPASPSATTTMRDGFELSNSGYQFRSKTNSTRGKWTTIFGGRFNNELLVGYQTVRDKRELPNRVPLIFVRDTAPNAYIAAGAERFSHANSLDQDIFEITDNLTFDWGLHRITVGTHNEFFSFNNVFFPASLGVWAFGSADSLAQGLPFRYERALGTAARPEGPVADFSVQQYGLYAQDQFALTPRLTITAGLRFDVPYNDKPNRNPALDSIMGINTADFPSGNILWSPRLGVNWDVKGDGNTIVRGGAGIFSGRPPYVWISNGFVNTGLEQVSLVCQGAGEVPTFTIDVDNLPSQCAGGGGPTAAAATINYFDPDFKFQQALKFSVGLDQRLPWGMVGTLDFLHTRNLNDLYLQDVNLVAGGINGEGRLIYGTPNPAGNGSITRTTVTSAFRQVVEHSNKNGAFSTYITAQVQKRFDNGVAFNASYSYGTTRDFITLGSSIATSNLSNTVLDGTQAARRRRRSAFDVPHKVTLSGTVALPFNSSVSLIYVGRSGTPFTYIVNGDANGDGISTNDIVYVPRDINDISLTVPTGSTPEAEFAKLDNFINQNACLRNQRGSIMRRNTCRNPWVNFVNARISKSFNTLRGQALEVTADIFNLLNFIDSDWGLVRESNQFEALQLLRLTGYDTRGTPETDDDRARYSLQIPGLERIQTSPSRWRVQLGARYTF